VLNLFGAIFIDADNILYATAYPAELGIRPLGYYKPVQYKILGSGTCTMLDDL
jgi:hypothetical protein